MNKILIAIIAVIIIAGGLFVVTQNNDDDQNTQETSTVESTDEVTVEPELESDQQVATISVEEVAMHSSESDCWTTIDSQVYDITSYIPNHPGGDEILRACGQDGSSLFNTRQTNDGQIVGSGTPHSPSAENILQDFFIGDLATN